MTRPLRYNNEIHFDSELIKKQRNMSLLDNKINHKINNGFT
jgi:hypothetical protein